MNKINNLFKIKYKKCTNLWKRMERKNKKTRVKNKKRVGLLKLTKIRILQKQKLGQQVLSPKQKCNHKTLLFGTNQLVSKIKWFPVPKQLLTKFEGQLCSALIMTFLCHKQLIASPFYLLLSLLNMLRYYISIHVSNHHLLIFYHLLSGSLANVTGLSYPTTIF